MVDAEAKLSSPERKANKNDNNRAHNENYEKSDVDDDDEDLEDEEENELFVSGGETGSRGSAHRQPPHGASYSEASKLARFAHRGGCSCCDCWSAHSDHDYKSTTIKHLNQYVKSKARSSRTTRVSPSRSSTTSGAF